MTDVQTILGFNTPQAIFKWMRGDAMPSIDNIVILAHILDVPIDEIIAAVPFCVYFLFSMSLMKFLSFICSLVRYSPL